MGTRAICNVRNDQEQILVTLYRQFDGDDLGQELIDFFESRRLVNGTVGSLTEVANGPECAAALLISHLKGNEAGNVYLEVPGSVGLGEEYVYDVQIAGNRTVIKAYSAGAFPDFLWSQTVVTK